MMHESLPPADALRLRIRDLLKDRARVRPLEILFWLAAVAALWVFPSRHLTLSEIGVLALFAMSLDMILGFAGIISLGHGAFLGLGAYTAGLLGKFGYGDPLLGLAAAALVSGLVGFASSFLVLRGNDLTRLMVTLAVSLVLGELANSNAWLTGGADGLQGVTISPVLGLFDFDLYGTTAYVYVLCIVFVLFWIARRVMNSPFGLSLRAIRDNPLRARAIGTPVHRRLVSIYTLAAIYAGIAGALLTQTTQFASLDVLDFHRSADVLLVLIIGGTGYLYGGFIGAIFFKVVQDQLSILSPQYWHFWIGLILVLIVLVGRDRLGQGPRALMAWGRSLARGPKKAAEPGR